MVLISVIITNYNYGQYLGRCIRSCLNQVLPKDRYEIIVVDDKSTDNSRKIIETFGSEIVPVFLEKNYGVAYASNEGIKKARGRYVIRVDADDYIAESTLLIMSELLTHNKDIGFVYCDHFLVDEQDNQQRVSLSSLEVLLNHGAGIMFRKSYLETLGLYDIELKNAEDYDLIKRYIKNFNGYHLKLPLYKYYRHGNNMTKNKEEREKWSQRVEEKHSEK